MWRIIATHTREGREIARREIDAGEVTIGRDGDRGLVLQSASVSRRHCKIRVDHTGAAIIDEGSANGVLVNGARIQPNAPVPIGPGVNVEIAEFRITVEPLMMGQPQMGMPPMQMGMPMGMPGGMPMGQMPGQMSGMMPQPMSQAMPGMMPMSGPSMVGMPMSGPGPATPSVDMVRLIAEGGQFNGRIFDLPPVAEMTVGRGVGNGLVLDDQSMSRKHAKIKRLGGGRIEVEDLNSSNGTYVNGRKVAAAQCGPGDTVRFGELSFRIDGAGGGARSNQGFEGSSSAALPPWVKPAFFGLAAATALVWVLLVGKLVIPSGASKAEIDNALKQKEAEAAEKIAAAKEALGKADFGKAKELVSAGLNIDPANLEGIQIRAQASRAMDEEDKYRQVITELDRNNPDGYSAAMRIYDAMPSDSKKRTELTSMLRGKMIPGGEEFCKKTMWRECFETLCAAARLGSEKLSTNTIKMLKNAQTKGRMAGPCPHVK
ncbi:MAG TPA: FHA domain-containing protein [Pseudomonadota bacterium]|nr:FHA domain-containing protein [Pseudomonadota bacterium]